MEEKKVYITITCPECGSSIEVEKIAYILGIPFTCKACKVNLISHN